MRIQKVEVLSEGKKIRNEIESHKPITIKMYLKVSRALKNYEQFVHVGMNIFSEDGHNLFGPNTNSMKVPSKTKCLILNIPDLQLNKGKYFLTFAVFDERLIDNYDHLDRIISFEVTANNKYYGSLDMPHKWTIEDK